MVSDGICALLLLQANRGSMASSRKSVFIEYVVERILKTRSVRMAFYKDVKKRTDRARLY